MATSHSSSSRVNNEDSMDTNSLTTQNGIAQKSKKADESKKQQLRTKLEKVKWKRTLQQQRSFAPSALSMSAIYEMKLHKVRKNNRALAQELSNQKQETKHWYDEVVSLKGELHEANEKNIRLTDKNYEKHIAVELDRRLREISEPLHEATNDAMKNLLVVVEDVSRIKQLVSRLTPTGISTSSSASHSCSSVPRTPLGMSASPSSSPCQSVLPMVSGHVLQPATVALQKLDDMWKMRVRERMQARETNAEMSTIGEQSLSNDEPSDISSHSVSSLGATPAAEKSASETSPSVDTTEPVVVSISKSPVSSTRTRGARSAISRSPPSLNASPVEEQVSHLSSGTSSRRRGKYQSKSRTPVTSPEVSEEDPLEGPSWWYSAEEQRGRSRRGRGGKKGRLRSTCTSVSPPMHKARHSLRGKCEIEKEESPKKKKVPTATLR